MRMYTVRSLSVTVTALPAAVVTTTCRVSDLSPDTTPITLSAVIAESETGEEAGVCAAGVCAASGSALAHNTNAHSTVMLPNFLMFFLWLKSQLISAQNQWFLRSKE
jgi:hypothetical protein